MSEDRFWIQDEVAHGRVRLSLEVDMAEHERVIGRFVPVGQEVHRDWIAVIVTRLTNNGRDWQEAEPEMFQIPEFENQFEEIKWWASEEGLKMMDAIMCIETEGSGSTGDVFECPHR